jgi:C4-dicarboxylate-binding protein DctP
MARTNPAAASFAGVIATFACAIGIGFPPAAQAAEYTMKFGVLSVNDAQHLFAEATKVAVEKATNGRVEVKVFPRGQLGSAAAHVQGLQLGTIEAFLPPIDFYAGLDPRAGVFSSPFLFKDRHHANQVAQSPEVFDEVMHLFENKGIVGGMIGSIADGKYIAKEPLRKLSDFKGKKLRVNATDAERERMKRLGATAIPMSLSEMVTSLQSGVIDGTMSGISIHVNFNLNNISKVLLETNDTMLDRYTGISKKWLDSMPPDLRNTVLTTIRSLKPEFTRLADRDDADLTKKWQDRGGTFVKFSPADQAEMRRLTESVGDDVTRNNPTVNSYYKKVKAISMK